jgi:hypothetical protein
MLSARSFEAVDADRVGDERQIRAAEEKAAFNYSDDSPDALLQPRWVSDWTEAAVENAIVTVSEERRVRRRQTQPRACTERFQSSLRHFQSERSFQRVRARGDSNTRPTD